MHAAPSVFPRILLGENVCENLWQGRTEDTTPRTGWPVSHSWDLMRSARLRTTATGGPAAVVVYGGDPFLLTCSVIAQVVEAVNLLIPLHAHTADATPSHEHEWIFRRAWREQGKKLGLRTKVADREAASRCHVEQSAATRSHAKRTWSAESKHPENASRTNTASGHSLDIVACRFTLLKTLPLETYSTLFCFGRDAILGLSHSERHADFPTNEISDSVKRPGNCRFRPNLSSPLSG
jgi:hypothetical protein